MGYLHGPETGGTTDDRHLLDEVGVGSREALAELFRRHGSSVYGLARVLSPDDRAAALVLEEVFTGLWSRSGRLEDPVVHVQLGLLGMALRRCRALRESVGPDEGSARHVGPLGRLRGMPAEHCQPLALRMLSGAPLSEIATVLGVERSRVVTQLRAALGRAAHPSQTLA